MVKVLVKNQFKIEIDPQILLRINLGDITVIENQRRVYFPF